MCKCHEGYTGPHCEFDNCDNNNCLNGGKELGSIRLYNLVAVQNS